MTAPDDVRARFEAWAIRQFGTSVQLRWIVQPNGDGYYKDEPADDCWDAYRAAHADLSGEAREFVEALHEGRRAIGDHYVPNDCYATGPLTGDAYRDLVQCPACSFIAMYDAALAKFTHQEKP